jgi:hypothetical protein
MTASHRQTLAWSLTLVLHAVAPTAASWSRAYIGALPDQAFAVVHVRPDRTKSRHLPHHDAAGRLDLSHLRSALARLGQVRWEDPADAERARQHLLAHQETLGIRRRSARPPASDRSR